MRKGDAPGTPLADHLVWHKDKPPAPGVVKRRTKTSRSLVVAYGKVLNRSRKSVALTASPRYGLTLKISSSVRSVELCV
jgi:hypothetical protein